MNRLLIVLFFLFSLCSSRLCFSMSQLLGENYTVIGVTPEYRNTRQVLAPHQMYTTMVKLGSSLGRTVSPISSYANMQGIRELYLDEILKLIKKVQDFDNIGYVISQLDDSDKTSMYYNLLKNMLSSQKSQEDPDAFIKRSSLQTKKLEDATETEKFKIKMSEKILCFFHQELSEAVVAAKVDNVLPNLLIIFSEHFFSRMPISSGEYQYMLDALACITVRCKNEQTFIIYNCLLKESVSNADITCYNERLKRMCKEKNIDSYIQEEETLDIVVSQLLDNNTTFNSSLVNCSFIYNEGKNVACYKKTTYCDEDNESLRNGGVYKFGNFLIQNINDENQSIGTKLYDECLCLRICRDAVFSPQQYVCSNKLHIVQSNFLLCDTIHTTYCNSDIYIACDSKCGMYVFKNHQDRNSLTDSSGQNFWHYNEIAQTCPHRCSDIYEDGFGFCLYQYNNKEGV